MKKLYALFDFFVLFLGSGWIAVNIFLLPFYPWTEGLYRPWLLLHGLMPYKDHLWNRGMADITLLAAVYTFIGVSPLSYQVVIASLLLLIGFLLYWYLRRTSRPLAETSYGAYVLLLFPLFANAEIEEILVGLFALCTLFSLWEFAKSKKIIFLICAGLFSGFSIVTKQTSGVLAMVTFLFLWKQWRNFLIYIGGMAVPLCVTVVFLWMRGALGDYISSLIFVATVYKEWAKAWGIGGALDMIGIYASVLVPFLFAVNAPTIRANVRHLLAGFIIALFIMLLPSYWSYRLVASFPLLSIALAMVILDACMVFRKKGMAIKKLLMVACLIGFGGFFLRFGNEYIRFVSDNGFSFGQYLLDYGQNELAAAQWLKEHTSEDEKVFTMANNIIMMRADRLPFNRYVGGMPIDYLPFGKTASEMTTNPPRVVVIDNRMLEDWPELNSWGFIDFLRKRYTLQQEFGEIGIYVL